MFLCYDTTWNPAVDGHFQPEIYHRQCNANLLGMIVRIRWYDSLEHGPWPDDPCCILCPEHREIIAFHPVVQSCLWYLFTQLWQALPKSRLLLEYAIANPHAFCNRRRDNGPAPKDCHFFLSIEMISIEDVQILCCTPYSVCRICRDSLDNNNSWGWSCLTPLFGWFHLMQAGKRFICQLARTFITDKGKGVDWLSTAPAKGGSTSKSSPARTALELTQPIVY